MKFNLKEILKQILLEQVSPLFQQLKDKYVGEGKPLSEDEFKQIEEIAHGKFYLLSWLTKKIGTGLLKTEDLYKWREYINIFEKNKKKFKFQDLNLFKTAEDIQNFIETVIQIKEGDIKYEDLPQSSLFLSKNEIEKLTSTGGNKYLGFWKPEKGLKAGGSDGYQVFEINEPTQENWKVYRDLLGRCKGRNKGATIEICTIGQYSYFKQYLKGDKGSKYIVLFNLNDPWSPYQLHVESGQFMNKNDIGKYNFDPIVFYKWLAQKSEHYNFEKIASHMGLYVPANEKSFENEKGKQGVWKLFEDGKLDGIFTFVNNRKNGPAITYHNNGQVHEKGTFRETRYDFDWVGDFESFYRDGKLYNKGTYDGRGYKIGVWRLTRSSDYKSMNVDYIIKDFSNPSEPVSGFTKNGILSLIADDESSRYSFWGKVIAFYKNGLPKTMGRLTKNGKKTGKWTKFDYDGSIKMEGEFRNNKPVGNWVIVFKKDGVKYIYEFDYQNPKEGKLYNAKGEFIKKQRYRYGSDRIPSVRDSHEF